MPTITFEGKPFECRDGETMLDALLRQGQSPPFSCRNGSCLVCLQRCTRGTPPAAAQRALRPSLQRAGYFLPCKCRPTEDLEVSAPRAADLYTPAVVVSKTLLASDVCQLTLEPSTSLYYHAGQFVNLRREDGLQRSYSLASLPSEDPSLEIHVKRHPGGALSNWIFDELAVGDELSLQGPNGRMYYVPGSQEQNLLLVGSGTGAAPLLGILRDALHVGHRGRIVVALGSRSALGLYLHSVFSRLSEAFDVTYLPCVSGPSVPDGFRAGRADQVVAGLFPDLRDWRVFTAGHPGQVAAVVALSLRAGVAPSAIHADPFDTREAPEHTQAKGSQVAVSGEPDATPRPEPDLELWKALGEGALMRVILEDFYTRVFEDAVLAPYFRGITKERLVGQVYSFMRDLLTGQRSYFGSRPRTAHHWMVISDEIFDHRERLMEACLRRHGLAAPLVERWRRIEEGYRADIVKASPWKLVVDGVERPLEGFGELVLTAGTLCDGCQRAVEKGEHVTYHLRLGLTYCSACGGREPRPS